MQVHVPGIALEIKLEVKANPRRTRRRKQNGAKTTERLAVVDSATQCVDITIPHLFARSEVTAQSLRLNRTTHRISNSSRTYR